MPQFILNIWNTYFAQQMKHMTKPQLLAMVAFAVGILATDMKLLLSAPVALAIAVLATAVAYWLSEVIFYELEQSVKSQDIKLQQTVIWNRTITFCAILAVVVIWLK